VDPEAAALCGRDRHIRVRPERAHRRERFGRKYVERGACERTFVQRRQDIRIDLQRAAPGIDQIRAARRAIPSELAQQREVEHSARRGSRWQQAHLEFRCGGERRRVPPSP
jgi:hypothetical protein